MQQLSFLQMVGTFLLQFGNEMPGGRHTGYAGYQVIDAGK